jgi:Domain of unknown function (DUF222)
MSSDPESSTLVQDMRPELRGLAEVDVVGLPDETVRSELLTALAALNQLSAYVARLTDSFATRDLAGADGFRGVKAWLVAFGRLSPGAATAWLARGRLLRALPALTAAAGQGKVSPDHLAKVLDLVARLGVGTVARYDQILADLAAAANPADVAKACERIAALHDPDGPDPDPEGEFERRDLTMSRQGNLLYLRGRLDPEGAAAVRTALEALMRPPADGDPRTAGQRRADALVELARLPLKTGDLPTTGGAPASLGLLLAPATLLGHQNADPDPARTGTTGGDTDPATAGPDDPATDSDACAACDSNAADPIADYAGMTPPAGKSKPRPGRHPLGLDRLTRAGVPPLPQPAWLDWFGEIPAAVAQRLACDASIWRIVLDPATGLPLDVGRKHRLVPPWIRRALHARDRGCRWPGCQAPSSWCDAHHLQAWWLGGQTKASEMVLLCRWHHVRVHEGQWRIELDRATGEVHVWRPDGRPYELGPSRPWTGPATQRGDPGLPTVA